MFIENMVKIIHTTPMGSHKLAWIITINIQSLWDCKGFEHLWVLAEKSHQIQQISRSCLTRNNDNFQLHLHCRRGLINFHYRMR
jgi:hypothetical protein